MRVDDKLILQTHGQLGYNILNDKSIHVTLLEHAHPRLEDHLGRGIRREPILQSSGEFEPDGSIQGVQPLTWNRNTGVNVGWC